jgi:hypothetical protein
LERKIKIISKEIGEVEAELLEECNPNTVKKIWKNLPIEAQANIWGEEIYFSIPVKIKEENTKDIVEIGDLGYWPPGSAFCIFFGPTPLSKGNEIRPANPVNVFGKIIGNPKIFKKISDGCKIRIEKA